MMKKHEALAWRLLSVLLILTMLIPTTLFAAPGLVVQAAGTGWRGPSADVADTGGDDDGFEEYPMYAYADDDDFARNWNGVDDRHRYYGFGFDSSVIPNGSDIAGIEVRLDGWADSTSNSPRYDVELSWNGGSNWSSVRSTSNLGNSQGTFYVGDQSDLWGHTWSAGELSNASFRVRIISRASGWFSWNRDFFLDWVAVRVTYASAHIDGTIWADDNANGAQDGAETGLDNVHVTIYRDDGDAVFEGGGQDPEVGSDDTNAEGAYDTGPFMDGYSYWIDVDTPANRYLTTSPEPRLVYLLDGSSVTANFGYAPETTINPDIEIAKTPDTQMVISGTAATFTIAVTNTGDVTLTNVTVTDVQAADCNADLGSLAPTEGTSYSCLRHNVMGEFTNSATATGAPPVGPDVSDTDTASVDVVNPNIEIAKTPDSQTVFYNSTVTFTIAITNTGNVTLTNVAVSDALAPNCNQPAGTLPDLAPGESTSYECTRANVIADFTNSATATSTPLLDDDVTDTDTAEVILDRTQICPAGMIAYWKLDETSGPTYDDFYGEHDGECAGNCPTLATGHVSGGQEFNGSNTGIDVPADEDFDWGPADSFSIEFWMKRPGTPTGNEVIVGRDDSATNLHWWVGVGHGAGDAAAFCLYDTGGTGTCVTGETVVTGGGWHHIVAVRGADANKLRIYVDGTEEDSEFVTYAAGFDSPTAALNIGWLNLSHGYHFDGTVDEIALYDKALSEDEIRQHHNEGLAGRWYCEVGPFAPKIVSIPVTDASVGNLYSYDVEAIGNPDPTYSLNIHPSGMTIDSVTGLIFWIPTLEQEGDHDVQVQASNLEGTDIQTFTIEIASSVIARWKLDETTGATYYDSHDGHDGTCGGQCPTPVTGYANGGQEFDGNHTEINVPAHADFDWGPGDGFTIEFWMKTDNASTCSGNKVVIGRDDSSTDLHWWIGCRDGGQATFYLGDTSGIGVSVRGTTDLTDGVWHHVVAVRDADADEIRIYVDGVEESSTPVTYAHGFDSPTAALNIGWLDLDPFYHFDGILDEIALYNTALDGQALAPDLDKHLYLPLVLRG